MSSWDSCIAGYVLKTLNRLRGLIMYLKILAQLGAHVTFFFPFKLLPQLISQVDSQRGRCVSSHIVCNIDNLERYRPCDTNMSMSVSAMDLAKHVKIPALLVLRRCEQKVGFFVLSHHLSHSGHHASNLSPGHSFPSCFFPWLNEVGSTWMDRGD